MTPIEIRDELRAFKETLGPDAYVGVSFNNGKHPLHSFVYPNGVGSDLAFRVDADEWVELFSLLRSRWEEHREKYEVRRVRTMALAIIRITAEQSVCSDAALRADGFDGAEVERYGEDACEVADSMAGNGPFTITRIAGANAA